MPATPDCWATCRRARARRGNVQSFLPFQVQAPYGLGSSARCDRPPCVSIIVWSTTAPEMRFTFTVQPQRRNRFAAAAAIPFALNWWEPAMEDSALKRYSGIVLGPCC